MPDHIRQELPGGQVQIFNMSVGKYLTLNTAGRTATLVNISDMPMPKPGTTTQKPVNFFDTFRNNLRAADAKGKRESLGTKQIDGREAVGFRLKKPETEITVWGDAKTDLPIVVEMKSALTPGMTAVMTDFEFNVKLDERTA